MQNQKIYNHANSRLTDYLNKDILNYSKLRNYDFGTEKRNNVSNLSKFISHRILNEFTVIKKILLKYKLNNVEKFIQEIFWRVYWKGWLENRPKVWKDFLNSTNLIYDHKNYVNACKGNTNISCFNEWVKELKNYNYLHNHTRMWFASIWIFTLNLPWQLGAKLFMEHLFDGDPASNTLSWRWVAGLQTKGKHYLAKSWNINKYTQNRFSNIVLNETAFPKKEVINYPLEKIYLTTNKQKKNDYLILFENDLCFENRQDDYNRYKKIFLVLLNNNLRKISLSKKVLNFKKELINSFHNNFSNSEICDSEKFFLTFNSIKDFDVIYPFIGENLDFIKEKSKKYKININFIFRNEDKLCWTFSQKGFFNFKKNIPRIIKELNLM